ncbi:hypothetical protein KDN24_23140 [Bacillus sp. Bva_UNVM-123]|uniref:hypothetical protein n=1 Tax=Bacillus sp. Bva_UNVM-123 TaxID=2829798 RepID=UPI00391F7A12
MRYFKGRCLFITFTLMLTGYAAVDKEKHSSNAKITIEPYDLSEKESLLISKTGVEQIEFFKMEGALKEEDDLQFAVEEYVNGKLKEELLTTSNEPNEKFKDSFISFGISNSLDEDHSLKLIAGIPSGLATTMYPNNMTSSSFSKLVGEKVTLEKNKPVYLAAWLGTTQNRLRSVGSENGELPQGIKEAELALLFRVLWTDK